MLATDSIVAGYRIDAVLGLGGMGVVYEATQLSLDRTVALKVVASHLGDDLEFRERFRREGLRQAAVDHPHVVPVYEAGESDGSLFLAMRLIRGTNLKELILDRRLSPEQTIQLLSPIAGALDAAHAAGLIHRDVKPQNILVDEGDCPYLADFGLTRALGEPGLTRSGQYVGTLHYVSPEQLRGEPATPSSDVYSLAAILYECLAGTVPFPRESDAAILAAHLFDAPPSLTRERPELPAAIDEVIACGMTKRPEDRYRSAGELMEAAALALSGDTRVVDDGRRSGLRRLAPAGLVAALLAGGFLLGRSGAVNGGPLVRSAAAGPLRLVYPTRWEEGANPPRIGGIELGSRISLVSTTDDVQLVAGQVAARAPEYLPSGFARTLAHLPRAEVVRLLSLDAYRYSGLRPKGSRRALTVYAVPNSAGVAAVFCVQQADTRPAARSECDAIASTLALRGVRVRDLRPGRAYARALTRLARARGQAYVRFLAARTAAAQARAARDLARIHRAAATEISDASVDPPKRATIAAALRRAAHAYDGLASAALVGDRVRYRRAARTVRAADANVRHNLRFASRDD